MAGFSQKIFDFSFTEFVTPSVIKVLYILALIGISLYCLISIISGFAAGFGYGLHPRRRSPQPP